MGAVEASHDSEELPMQTVTTIGFDIAKSVFQVHGVDAAGEVVILADGRQIKQLVLASGVRAAGPSYLILVRHSFRRSSSERT